MFNTKITQGSLREKNQELTINKWAYQAILYSPFALPWEFEGEGEKNISVTRVNFFPGAQQTGQSIEVRGRKLANVPWAPREEIRKRSGFPQDISTPTAVVSKLLLSGVWCILKAVSVWVLRVDIKMRLDKQEIYWEEGLWRIKGKQAAVGRESLKNMSRSDTCERREGGLSRKSLRLVYGSEKILDRSMGSLLAKVAP